MSGTICHAIIRIECTESTNNYATSQVRVNEVKTGTVFLAYSQTSGRGQLNNQWESEAGKNLTFSIFLKPFFLDIRNQFLLSKVVCLGIEAFLSEFIDQVKIKWPNDIYVGERKICGILIENTVMNANIKQSIIGIGLNINQTEFLSAAPNPVSLKMITGKDSDLEKMLNALLVHIDHFYQMLACGQENEIDQLFYEKLFRLEEWHTYKDETHEYQGKIIGVNGIGQLKIQEREGHVLEYHFKEVAYL